MELKHASILVVDDDRDLLIATQLLLKPKVAKVSVEHNPENLPALLSRHTFDVVLLDMNYKSKINTGNEGIYWLTQIKTKYPAIKVVMITAYAAVDLAVQALKQGASDFLVKPWYNDSLLETIKMVLSDKKSLVSKTDHNSKYTSSLIGKSAIMEDLQYKIRKIAPTDANILILGENGTGKDLIASAIHEQSLRKEKPYIKVDVGALTETLFESELFGYKKGAFTDAREDRKGRFEVAEGGTLFMDEIGNISLHQQAKLLSVLQNREVLPLGANTPIPIDIRLLSATNVSLAELSDEKRFRKDLIYRINTVEIQVPTLRARGDDILLLAAHFLQVYNQKYHKNLGGLSRQAEKKMMEYHFPGNVRELQYAIERAVIMAEQEEIGADDLLFSPIEQPAASTIAQAPTSTHLESMERQAIELAMDRHQGNISKAAQALGLTRAALYRRLQKYNI